MKNFFHICLLFFTLLGSLSAQIVDHSLNVGFSVNPHIVRSMGDGKWLVVGTGAPYPGALFRDTVFALIYDQQGQILLQKKIPFPTTENLTIDDALALPDGDFLLAYSGGDCDAGGYFRFVSRYGTDGPLKWSLMGSIFTGELIPPPTWKKAPDGNLLGFDGYRVWKVDAVTGTVLSKAELTGSGSNTAPYTLELLPGTEDFIGIGFPNFQVWRKTDNSSGDPIYTREDVLDAGGFYLDFVAAPNGRYYALDGINYKLERIDASLNREVLNVAFDLHGYQQMIATDDALYFLGRQNGQNWLYVTNLGGQNAVQLPVPDRWLKGYSLDVQGEAITVAGVDGSGPQSVPDEFSYREFQASQLWLRTFSASNMAPDPDSANAAITNLHQLATVDTSSYSAQFGGRVFVLKGGDFEVQITNHGNTVLDRAYVHFGYEENRDHFCYFTAAVHRSYSNLQLAPGESTWVAFGGLPEQGQSSLSTEFCFWTSAPNGQPDAWHDDDFYCQPAAYTVAAHSPTVASVLLQPNPAQDYFQVSDPTIVTNTEWRLFDATGHLVQRGICTADQAQLTVSTRQLPNGLYFFRINNRLGKLTVQH